MIQRIGRFLGAPPGEAGENLQMRGIILILLAIFLFTLMDASAKGLAPNYHPAQIVWARYTVNLLIVLPFFARNLRRSYRTAAPAVQICRGLSQLASAALFFASLRFIGLAEATAIMDSNPVLITLGAALFLGERIGPRRIIGIAVALTGAMIIIRPGASVFQPAALLPMAGAFTYAAGALLTRMARVDRVGTSVLWTATVGTVATSLVVPFVWQPIAAADLPLFLMIGVFGATSQVLLIRAFTLAEAAAIAPFGYSGIIFATFWGWLFWGNLPDLWTVVGAIVVVSAGLYVWAREVQDMKRQR